MAQTSFHANQHDGGARGAAAASTSSTLSKDECDGVYGRSGRKSMCVGVWYVCVCV